MAGATSAGTVVADRAPAVAARPGGPLLAGQKILAERFFQQVQDKIIAPGKPSVAIRAAFSVLFHAYKLCAFGRGPQSFILARRVGETPESP